MAGSTDIKLLDNEVRIEGHHTVTAQTWDFCVDAPDRRKENKNPHRRALVHDFQDGLTINWANDYPGGVTVNGEVKFTGGLMFQTWVKTEVSIGNTQRPGPEVLAYRSLADVIFELQQEVAALKQEVAALKN